MERTAVLYIVRLCVPLILVIFLSLYFFYVNDSYHQLDLSFNSLLLITLIGIEVKDFMPDHVVVITWIDWFLLANILLVVFVTGLSLLIIVFEEWDNPLVSCLADTLDRTVKRSQVDCGADTTCVYVATILNMVMICMGYGRIVNIGSPFSNAPYPTVDDVRNVVFIVLGLDVILCAILFLIGAVYKRREVRAQQKIELALEVKREMEDRANEAQSGSEQFPNDAYLASSISEVTAASVEQVRWY